MSDHAGKRFWIIGASSGIGRALAREFHARGAKLFLSARNEEALLTLNQNLGNNHTVLPFDVTNEEDFAAAVAQVGAIDSVIYLAATYTPGKIANITAEDVHKTLSVNIGGAFTLLRYIIPHYKHQGYGQIALCGSVAGYKGLPGGQPYSATKAAIINLAESVRVEARKDNIDVRLINPGFVETPLTDKNDFFMPMMIKPEEAARHIVNGLLGKKFEVHFPKKFTFLMKLLNFLPYKIYFFLAAKLHR